MADEIPFYRPYLTGSEIDFLREVCDTAAIASDGKISRLCIDFLKNKLGLSELLLTPSCTVALEIAVHLMELEDGDEVIMPSFSFSSTANAVLLGRGRPVFVDLDEATLNIDPARIEAAITRRTRAILVVHYGGVACDMDRIDAIAERHGLLVVEDAAHAVGATHKARALGSLGHLGAYSFHYTKNFLAGEGGALCINDNRFFTRAQVLREKGTNRQAFMAGEVDKYTWVDIGVSGLPSELSSAFLLPQLQAIDEIVEQRRLIYRNYLQALTPLADRGLLTLPTIPDYAGTNYHFFHILLRDRKTRDGLIDFLRDDGITAVFHFVPLHSSPMGRDQCKTMGRLAVTEMADACLLRLPFFIGITENEQQRVVARINSYFATMGC